MATTCRRCGKTWPQDPALAVPCPQCHAPAGSPCRRPSGHGCALHTSRDQAALDAGLIEPCPGDGSETLLPQMELDIPQAPPPGELAL